MEFVILRNTNYHNAVLTGLVRRGYARANAIEGVSDPSDVRDVSFEDQPKN
jgi:hypothetical protein